MKKLLIVAVVLMLISSVAYAEEWGKEDKLKRIDQEIEQAQKGKKSGIIKVCAGLGCYGLSFLFIPTTTYEYDYYSGSSTNEEGNAALWGTCLVVGGVLEIWGAYQWWANAQEVGLLKAKRYDIGFYPTIKNDLYGVNLRVNF